MIAMVAINCSINTLFWPKFMDGLTIIHWLWRFCLSIFVHMVFAMNVTDMVCWDIFVNSVLKSDERFCLLLILIQVFYSVWFLLRVQSYDNVFNIFVHNFSNGKINLVWVSLLTFNFFSLKAIRYYGLAFDNFRKLWSS